MQQYDYVFYVYSPAIGNWAYVRVVAETAKTAYEAAERELSIMGTLKWELKAGELLNSNIVYQEVWFKQRVQDLISSGHQFPEGFDPNEKPEVEVIDITVGPRKKVPEVCLEVFCNQDRSNINFSKITADLVKAQPGSLR